MDWSNHTLCHVFYRTCTGGYFYRVIGCCGYPLDQTQETREFKPFDCLRNKKHVQVVVSIEEQDLFR